MSASEFNTLSATVSATVSTAAKAASRSTAADTPDSDCEITGATVYLYDPTDIASIVSYIQGANPTLSNVTTLPSEEELTALVNSAEFRAALHAVTTPIVPASQTGSQVAIDAAHAAQ